MGIGNEIIKMRQRGAVLMRRAKGGGREGLADLNDSGTLAA